MSKFGSWPGPLWGNKVIEQICKGLEAHGIEVAGIASLRPASQLREIKTLIVHWPEQIIWGEGRILRSSVRMLSVLAVLASFKLRGGKIIWLAHNAEPHDLPKQLKSIWKIYSYSFVSLVDGWMTLSPSTKDVVLRSHKSLIKKPWRYAWHPAYPSPKGKNVACARENLKLPKTAHIFIYAGSIRPYKGLEDLIAAFKEQSEARLRLVLAGAPIDRLYGDKLRKLARSDDRIIIRFFNLSESEYQQNLIAADTFVAPFKNTLHSGSIIHALSLGLPVLAPSLPFTRDLMEALGENWVKLFHDRITPKDLRYSFGPTFGQKPDMSDFSPTGFGAELIALSNQVHSETTNAQPAALRQIS